MNIFHKTPPPRLLTSKRGMTVFVHITDTESMETHTLELDVHPEDIFSMARYERLYREDHPNTVFRWSTHHVMR